MVARYGLTATTNAANASARNWGSGQITAADQVRFLSGMSVDPLVGPMLTRWMAAAEPTAADGFDQAFGLNAVAGDHGSKQGWSDVGWEPYNIHSVGWTGHFFVAILQTSYTATGATMKATSTSVAQVLTELSAALHPVARVAASPGCTAPGWLGAVLARVLIRPLSAVLSKVVGTGAWCTG